MNRFLHFAPLLVAVLLLNSCISTTEEVSIPPELTQFVPALDENIEIIGRHLVEDDSLLFSWPSTRIAFQFQGQNCDIQMNVSPSSEIWYEVIVDGLEPRKVLFTSRNDLHPLVRNLDPGLHSVELIRVNEDFAGISEFQGLWLEEEGQLTAPAARSERRIEIIGDSNSCGFGVESNDRDEPFKLETENSEKAFGSYAARSFGAEYMVIASSGRGVYRDCAGGMEINLPQIYGKALTQREDSWDFHLWVPQLVIISLGANDFALGPPDEESYLGTYEDFILQINENYQGNAKFMCIIPSLSNYWPINEETGESYRNLDNFRSYTSGLAERMAQQHGIHLEVFEQSPMDTERGYGALWHHNEWQQGVHALELEQAIADYMNW